MTSELQVNTPELKTNKLTKLERQWWNEYLSIGCVDATNALRNIYKRKKVQLAPTSERSMASAIRKSVFTKLNISDTQLMDAMGMTDESLMTDLIEGRRATRALILDGKVVGVPDFPARHRFTETALRIKGKLTDVSKLELTGKDGEPLRIELVAGIGFLNKPKDENH